jgi:hypothetical protein
MRAAKFPLAIVFALLLIALPICAQVCDLNCSFYGCALATSTNTSQETDAQPPCHKHKSHGQAPVHKHTTNCAGHTDVMALRSSISASASAPLMVVSTPAAAPLVAFRSSSEWLVASVSNQPDRSPPTRAVLRI